MNFIFSFAPVLLFLGFLFLLDNFRLVQLKFLAACLIWGVFSAIAAKYVNTFLASWLDVDFTTLSRYISPFVEEILKALIIIYLIQGKKIGFMADSAILGFAAGTGFALMENLLYLFNSMQDNNLLIWIIRGVGTAIMHGGNTALMALITIAMINRSGKPMLAPWPGCLLAIILHSAFNHFPLDPLFQTLLVLVLFPVIFLIVFRINKSLMQRWLEVELSSEVEILAMVRKGEFRDTRAGRYLLSVKDRFNPHSVVDMYCYLSLYMELSIMAKRNLMLRENGFEVPDDSDLSGKLKELEELRRRIGRVGELTLSPLLRMSYRNLWKLNQLKAF